MSTYRGIRGTLVSTRTANPDNPNTGDIWYRSDTGDLQLQINLGSWASGGNMNTGRQLSTCAATSADSGIIFGGGVPAGSVNTETYNGTSWTEVNNLNQSKMSGAGGGNVSSAFMAGDNSSPGTVNMELWDGTNWTEVNNLNTPRRYPEGLGASNTAGLVVGGISNTNVESWDGTNFTEVADLNTAKSEFTAHGVQTSALAYGQQSPSTVESWDGSSWTETTEMNTGRSDLGGSGTSNSSNLAFGGRSPSPTAATEEWDGTSWTEIGDLSAAVGGNVGGGTTSSALNMGGSPVLTTTSEWTVNSTTQKATVS
jgi:hypothetical protein